MISRELETAVRRHTRAQEAIRQHERAIRARFDAAQTTDENRRHWANADYLGPNAELDPAVRQRLRSRARYECGNNTYASGMVETLADDTIGTGPSLQVIGYSNDVTETIEDIFWEWCLAAELPEKLHTLRQAKARDGEGFGSLFTNPGIGHPVQLDVQLHEAEMIAAPILATDVLLSDGIIYDDFGNALGYHLLDEHPGEGFGAAGESTVVPARDMIHLYKRRRAGQLRGYPEITAALPLYAQLRRYTLAVLRAAEAAALMTWLLETQGQPGEYEPGVPFDTVETERGMGMTLPGGWKMSQLKAEQPTGTYAQFKREIIAEIARCLGIPYNVAAGDSSSYNYSSGRLDHRTYYKKIRIERSYFETRALDVIFARWWREAVLIDNLLPESVRHLRRPPRHEWRWDGEEHVDPTKEADATGTRLKLGLTSYFEECARLGTDVSVVHAKNAQVLGLSIEEYRARLTDSLFGPRSVPQAAPKPEDDEDEEEPAANPQGGAK